MSSSPQTRTVILTGAARGLGRAMTFALAEAGCNVAALDLAASAKEMDELMAEAKRLGLDARILPLACDITDEADCIKAVAATVARFGAVDGLINNAGLGMQDIGAVLVGPTTKFYEVDSKRWRATMDVNINGAFLMAKACVPHFLKQSWGRIVNVTTNYVTMGAAGGTPYGPSKAALELATVAWAKDLAHTGVTANVLVPGGPADTRMIPGNEVKDRASLIQPAAMGPPAAWLMSESSDGITGFRFSAKDWNLSLAPIEAARRAGARAGW